MNKSPLNYLITIALGGILWIITAVFYGDKLSQSVILSTATPEDFVANLRIYLGIAAGLGILMSVYWYYYGSQEKVAGELNLARKKWWTLFIFLLIACAGVLFGLIFKNLKEGIASSDWIIVFILISLHTWFFYWLCTYLMSPRTVKFIPLFK